MFTRLDYSSALENSIIRRYTNIVYYYYEDKCIEKYYMAWRKAMRKVWKLPNLTHCNLLPVITNCLPLNIILEKRFLKFIWSIINSENS